jgi:N-acetylmuramoyl-L-alanine amidase
VSGDDVSAVRAAQTTDSSVRIVVDLKTQLAYKQIAGAVPNHFEIALLGPALHRAGNSIVASVKPIKPKSIALPSKPIHVVVVPVPAPVQTPSSSIQLVSNISDTSDNNSSPQVQNIISERTKDTLTLYVDVQPAESGESVSYHDFMLDNPSRLAFDIPGGSFNLPPALTENGSNSIDFGADNSIATRLRWGNADPASVGGKSSARVVLDLNKNVGYQISSSEISGGMIRYTIVVQPSKDQVQIAAVPSKTQPNIPVNQDNTPQHNNDPEIIVTPKERNVDPNILLPSRGENPDPAVVIVQPTPTPAEPVATPAPQVQPTPTIQPVITTPPANVPDSVLNGKTIVVDPGHGGKDEGAPGVHGILEKNVVLAIAKILRDDLVACGAKVIMTRADDTFIPLADRSQMGIDNHADFFISVHADSSGVTNSHNGSTVYYHANNATCHTMAMAIAQRLSQVAEDDGIKGDGVLTW